MVNRNNIIMVMFVVVVNMFGRCVWCSTMVGANQRCCPSEENHTVVCVIHLRMSKAGFRVTIIVDLRHPSLLGVRVANRSLLVIHFDGVKIAVIDEVSEVTKRFIDSGGHMTDGTSTAGDNLPTWMDLVLVPVIII